jgi:hypothetical protein
MAQEQQTPGERALELIRLLLPNWQPTTQDVLRWIRLALAVGLVILGVLFILDVIGLLFGITLLNLLKVLAIPITVGAAVPLLNWLQKRRELEVENQRAQDEALQAYLDQMGQLLLERDISGQLLITRRDTQQFEGDFISALVRSRTLTILATLDSDRPISRRKGSVLQFLYESGLVKKAPEGVVKLRGEAKTGGPLPTTPGQSAADLSRADLRRATLSRADLSGTRLSYAFLSDAKLDDTDLNDINLFHTDLSKANLERAELREADLGGADLSGANLKGADLKGADLSGADLSGADLSGAKGVTNEQLRAARSLEGATMPDGQTLRGDKTPNAPTFEDWLKSKDRAGDGETPNRS